MQHRALAQSPEADTPCVWKSIYGRFLLKLSRINPCQVMYIVKFDPNVLNFGYDFFLLVPFLGHPVDCHEESLNWTTKLIWS